MVPHRVGPLAQQAPKSIPLEHHCFLKGSAGHRISDCKVERDKWVNISTLPTELHTLAKTVREMIKKEPALMWDIGPATRLYDSYVAYRPLCLELTSPFACSIKSLGTETHQNVHTCFRWTFRWKTVSNDRFWLRKFIWISIGSLSKRVYM